MNHTLIGESHIWGMPFLSLSRLKERVPNANLQNAVGGHQENICSEEIFTIALLYTEASFTNPRYWERTHLRPCWAIEMCEHWISERSSKKIYKMKEIPEPWLNVKSKGKQQKGARLILWCDCWLRMTCGDPLKQWLPVSNILEQPRLHTFTGWLLWNPLQLGLYQAFNSHPSYILKYMDFSLCCMAALHFLEQAGQKQQACS